MASWLSGKIEGDENRPSPVQPRSKIPVRRVTRLNNDSGKSSSSKDEADQNQRMLRDSVDKLQNKRPSRIPIVVGQTNSKTGKDKLHKNVIAATLTGKRPLGKDSGINLRETPGKQAARIKTTANPPTAAKDTKPVTQSTPPVTRIPIRQVTPLKTKQVSNDEKEPRNDNTKVQDESVLSVDLSATCKINREEVEENVQNDNTSRGFIGAEEAICFDYGHVREEVELLKGSLDLSHHREELLRSQVAALEKQTSHCKNWEQDLKSGDVVEDETQKSNGVSKHEELEQLEKIVEELQLWVEDGDKRNKTLEEVIEKTNEENVNLLVQISVMKNELKALEEKNDTLQKLSEKEHSEIEGELQLWVEDGDKKNKTLEEVIEKTNEENVKLLVQISVMKNELKALEEKNDTLQKLSEKEHSEIEGELQLWVEDGDKKNKTLEEVIEKTNEENVNLLVQISVMKKELKALEEKNDTLQKLSEKEHSEIEGELQLWVEDGDKKNKTLEEVIEKTNEENVNLLVQISVMKKELKTLEEKNDTLQKLSEKEHSEIEGELQLWVEDGDKKNKTLEEVIEKTNEENVKLLVQISVMKNGLKALEEKNDTLQKLSEKEHSEIEGELQLWVEDGDKKNKTLEEVVEKTNEENVNLLVQISVMKKELKALEEKNDTLQKLSEKEHSEIEGELQLWVEDGDKKNKTLEEVVEKTNEENVKLLVQISVMKNELKALEEKNDTLQKLSEKEHSEIEGELQLWVEDGDKKNKTLEEVIEKTNEENVNLLVQISVMKKELKALEEKNDTLQKLSEKEHSEIEGELQLWVEDGDKKNKTLEEVIEKTNEENVNLLVQISVMKKELKALEEKNDTLQKLSEKEHSEIEGELQLWVEDGDKKNKTLEEVVEKTNEENVKLLVQISVMKNELKALEKKSDTLQTKRLKAKEHYNERELRNLKRDLKRKEQNLEEAEESLDNALMEKHELLVDVDYLESRFKDSQASNEQLNARVDELEEMVNELEKQRDQTSRLIDQLEYQLDTFITENARIVSEKDNEINELKDEKSRVKDQLEDELAMLRKDNSTMTTELSKELNDKDNRLAELQEQVENLREQKKLTQLELDLAYRSLDETDAKIDRLMKELEQERSDNDVLCMALEGLLRRFLITEKEHDIKTDRIKNKLLHVRAGMGRLYRETTPTILAKKEQILKQFFLGLSESLTFLLNKADSCSVAGNKTQFCGEKYFAM
ncbi:hypothetical protein OS493_025980 [Desmophyllum pertusum]|uniref:Uncharacterized protein n=1 Tax=Desmophyllum pertusum TaxID=174260 RepID=A0A9X0CL59_9CNID|nr:hypothetical protein OS493_025980 [Desmophyllum pertusum]